MGIVITGHSIVLREITYDDTNDIVRWRNNTAVRDNFIFREPFTPEMHNHWMKTQVETGQVVQFIIAEKATNQSIGSVYFRDINHTFKSAEFGIFIGEDSARGKGYGREAIDLFVEYGFNELKLHRIGLRVIKTNEHAYRTYVNAGFKVEGIFSDMIYFDDKYYDVVFMARINKEEG